MGADAVPRFRGGVNIAVKVPPPQFDETVRFYRETLGLPCRVEESGSAVVEYGPNRLWLDPVPTASHAEVWLEVVADDPEAAAAHLARAGVVRRDEIEPLPDGFRGFWVASPAGTITLVTEPGA